MSRRHLALGAALSALSLTACTAAMDEAPPDFGRAVASMDSQIVPPAADSDTPAESSGARGVEAIRRYERGEVKQPPQSATSDIAAETGGGDQGGGLQK
jgi:hypothetical protein